MSPIFLVLSAKGQLAVPKFIVGTACLMSVCYGLVQIKDVELNILLISFLSTFTLRYLCT